MPQLELNFAGTDYRLRLTDEAHGLLERLYAGDATVRTIPVTYLADEGEDEMDDEVDAVWIACISKRFDACRKLLEAESNEAGSKKGDDDESDEQSMAATVLELVGKAVEHNDAGVVSGMQAAFEPAVAEGSRWSVALCDLLSDNATAAAALSLGFVGGDLSFPVPPQEHECAVLFAHATRHLALDPEDAAPLCAGSPFSAADACLLRRALDGKLAEDDVSGRARLGGQLAWVGHVFFAVARHRPSAADGMFRAVVAHDAFWSYISDRSAPQEELTVRIGDKIVRYRCRLDRILKELVPQMPEARLSLLQAQVRQRQESAAVVDTGILVDRFVQCVDELLEVSVQADVQEPEGTPEEQRKKRFETATERAKKLEDLKNNSRLQLYGLYKQATEGDCTKPKPGMLDFEGKAKWQAWTDKKGLTSSEAMDQYAAAVDSFSAA